MSLFEIGERVLLGQLLKTERVDLCLELLVAVRIIPRHLRQIGTDRIQFCIDLRHLVGISRIQMVHLLRELIHIGGVFGTNQPGFGIDLILNRHHIIFVLLFGQIQLLLKCGLVLFQRENQRFQLLIGGNEFGVHRGQFSGDLGHIGFDVRHFHRIFGVQIGYLEIQHLGVFLIRRLQDFQLRQIFRLFPFQSRHIVLQIGGKIVDFVFEILNLFQKCRLVGIVLGNRIVELGLERVDLTLQFRRFRVQGSGQFIAQGIQIGIQLCLQCSQVVALRIPDDTDIAFDDFLIVGIAQTEGICSGLRKRAGVKKWEHIRRGTVARCNIK